MLAFALPVVAIDVLLKVALVLMAVDVAEITLFRSSDPQRRTARAFALCALLCVAVSVFQHMALCRLDPGSPITLLLAFATAWGLRIWLLPPGAGRAPLGEASAGAIAIGVFAGLCAFWFGGLWLFSASLTLPRELPLGLHVSMGGLAILDTAFALWVGWRTAQHLRQRAAHQ